MNLLKEFSRGDMQNDLKTSDGSSAGSSDTAMKKVDVGFSLMRNMINTDGQVSGSDVNDYLERAQDLNDEVESVGFAIETDDGDIIKIYVNAQEADGFEEEMSKLLGLEGDIEEAINQLAQKFDIVDVVWPRDPEGEGEQDPDAELSIDDGDVFAGTDPEAPSDADGSVLPADDDALPGDDTAAAPGEGEPAGDEPAAATGDEPATDDEDFEDIPRADATAPADGAADDDEEDVPRAAADDEAPADGAAPAADDEAPAEDEAEMEPVLNDDGTQKLDKDGNPVMRKKKKEKAKAPSLDDLPSGDDETPIKTEEGLSRLSRIAEAARDELAAHAEAQLALGDKGKYMIMATISGDTHGLRTRPLKRAGEVAYFESAEEAQAEATRLTREKNRAGATASYRYVPKLVEDKQPQPKENTMTIGSKFLTRVTEDKSVEDKDAVKDGMNIPLDTQQRQLVANLKRPIEKKLIAFFAMAGVIGRLLKGEPDIEDRVRAAGDMLRKNAAAKNDFNAFYAALATARGYGVTEALVVERGEHSAERKRGASVQQKFEAVMVALGLPEGLITTTGPGPIASYVAKTAKLIDASGELQTLLNTLANRLGVRGAEAPEDREAKAAKKTAPGAKFESIGASFMARMDEVEVKSMDPFAKDVIELLRALGVPSEHLSYKPQVLKAALEAKGKSLKNRSTVDQYVARLAAMVAGNVKPEAKPTAAPARTMGKGPAMAAEGMLAEAFGELEALTRSDLEHFNMSEPSAGPAMMAAYNGADSHAETVLAIGIDPEATGRLTLRVGIDGPWDGSMHHRYFPDDEEGYKSALKYANMMRTVNLKTGGRPKGWK